MPAMSCVGSKDNHGKTRFLQVSH